MCMKEAQEHGRNPTANDMVALGGHLVMGRDQKETEDLYQGFGGTLQLCLQRPALSGSDGSVEGRTPTSL